jgi:RHS repeat-associated protein
VSLSCLGTGGTVASDGTDDYSYTPSGTVTAAGTPGGTAFTTMTDQHGDVVGTFSPTSTAEGLAGYSSYSPYGAETATNFGENLGYQGDYTDPVTGLVYMNARWYNPATGSFVSGDTLNGTPVPSAVDGNPYAYAGGNPVTGIDPTGHSAIAPGEGGGGETGFPGEGFDLGDPFQGVGDFLGDLFGDGDGDSAVTEEETVADEETADANSDMAEEEDEQREAETADAESEEEFEEDQYSDDGGSGDLGGDGGGDYGDGSGAGSGGGGGTVEAPEPRRRTTSQAGTSPSPALRRRCWTRPT